MTNYNMNYPLDGLLERVNGAAVAAEDGIVREYNDAAARLLPTLRELSPLEELEEGGQRIRLCGVELECVRFEIGALRVYTFAIPPEQGLEAAGNLASSVGAAMLDALNSSYTASELLFRRTADDEKATQYNAILRHNQYRLLQIAHNLRLLSALQQSDRALDFSILDLNEICVNTVMTVHRLIRDRGIDLEYDYEGRQLYLYGDETLLEKTLLDLLANSAAHCERGCRITLRLERKEDKVELTVRDNGSGISEAGFSQVLDPFRQPAAIEPAEGAGLSLAVARVVIQRHNGRMIVRSAPGEGTSVLISLPLLQDKRTVFHNYTIPYETNPMRPALTAFSGLLDYHFYLPPEREEPEKGG